MRDSLVDIHGLSVDYRTSQGTVRALRNVDLQIPKNKVLGIVGESGSGKSTLVWAITRLLAENATVSSGEILFEGQDVLAMNQRNLAQYRGEQVSIVFQNPMNSQIPVLSYRTQMNDIQYRRTLLSTSDKTDNSVKMLRRVGIPDPEVRVKQFPHQFSGGMRQRAGIAMSLLLSPSLLIADEPTTALDVTMEAQIIHLLRELNDEFQATVAVVSHNLGLIAQLCDEVAIMYGGEVVERGTVNQIFKHAQHPYTRALLECDPAALKSRSRLLPVIAGGVPDLTAKLVGCVFAPRCIMAVDRCTSEAPPFQPQNDGPSARCHFAKIEQPALETLIDDINPETPVAPETPDPSDLRELLRVDSLNIRFRSANRLGALLSSMSTSYVDAVIGVSLNLHAGETLAIVGESGAGKTTLARAILGLQSIASGSVVFDGRETSRRTSKDLKYLRQNATMMFQDPIGSLSPRQTVRQAITEHLSIEGMSNDLVQSEAERLADMVGLSRNLLGRFPHELSGGQARRAGTARALAVQPQMIVADEPTAGLDVSVQGEVLNLLNELQDAHGLAYLVITHNLPIVRHISDRIAIMYMGRIVEQGPCHVVYDRPSHPYTHALVSGVPIPDPETRHKLVSIEGTVPSLANRPRGCEFHPRCPSARAVCRNESPGPLKISNGHTVRCHFPLEQ